MADQGPNLKVVTTTGTVDYAVLGDIPVESYGITAEALAHALALGMLNAGTEQFSGSQIADAAVAKACAAILKKGGG